MLIYPVTNYAFDTPSYQENANASPYVSPLKAKTLRGLPPAM
jgi:acetyl esterase/lipase